MLVVAVSDLWCPKSAASPAWAESGSSAAAHMRWWSRMLGLSTSTTHASGGRDSTRCGLRITHCGGNGSEVNGRAGGEGEGKGESCCGIAERDAGAKHA
jgi:hypothetical protein